MNTFKVQAAQGDVWFRRIESIPSTAKESKSKIVAHSETGHHHSFPKDSDVTYYTTNNPSIAYLRVESASLLEHHRGFDTHGAYQFEPGCYELRRPQEYVSERERRIVED